MTDRRSSKHGPRLDDALKRETASLERGAPVEAHVEEWREHEPSADYEPVPASRTAPAGALGPDAVQARRELSRHLDSSCFPADREGLLAEARSNRAPLPVLDALGGLPAGTTFATVHEVWAALGRS